jgi:G3E family GTPase
LEQEELAHWLARLPDEEIEYVEWLIEEVEGALDNIVLEQTGLEDAQKVLKKFTKKNEDKS